MLLNGYRNYCSTDFIPVSEHEGSLPEVRYSSPERHSRRRSHVLVLLVPLSMGTLQTGAGQQGHAFGTALIRGQQARSRC